MRLPSESEPARLETLLALVRKRRRERIQTGLEFSLILFALGVLIHGSMEGEWIRECPVLAQALVWYAWVAAAFSFWCTRSGRIS